MAKITINGEQIQLEKGMTYAELAAKYAHEDHEVILVREGGKLKELHKQVNGGKEISFITTADLAGFETYRRSCSMLFMKAVQNVAGKENVKKIILHFSIDAGFFYTIQKEDDPECGWDGVIDQAFVEKVEAEMHHLVELDLPIEKNNVPTPRAREIFREEKMFDKDRLFRFRIVSKTNIYSLDGMRDYYYGYMAHRTGILKYFKLYAYEHGILLQMPTRSNPEEVPVFTIREKLFRTQMDAELWAERVHIRDVGELNETITFGGMFNPILLSEAHHESKISEIAGMIAERDGVKFVMIAGPSSSGKTTFSQRLCVQLQTHGLNPHYIGVDNYFVNREDTPLDEFGKRDYECLGAIDVAGFNKDMTDLLEGKTIKVPSFNFQEGRREYRGETLSLPENDILVIEGIHCLNDALSESLPAESKFKIYMSALQQLNLDEHDRLSTTECRMIRRMVRDNRTRGYSAANTIGMWESVRRGEDKYIFPYQETADVFFNSALPYELAILKPYVQPLLFQIEEGAPEYDEARRLLKFLDYVIGIPGDMVPTNSILREFIGGGCFHL